MLEPRDELRQREIAHQGGEALTRIGEAAVRSGIAWAALADTVPELTKSMGRLRARLERPT